MTKFFFQTKKAIIQKYEYNLPIKKIIKMAKCNLFELVDTDIHVAWLYRWVCDSETFPKRIESELAEFVGFQVDSYANSGEFRYLKA